MDAIPQSPALSQMDFDTTAFGCPYFRVTRFDEAELAASLGALSACSPWVADAKAPAGDLPVAHGLLRLGFRKVCMQMTLRHDLLQPVEEATDVEITDRLPLEDAIMWRHARNFNKDRFSLDPLIPAESGHRLYYQWFRNSLGGGKQVAHIGANVATFSRKGADVVIDLVSILEPRRGFGSRIMRAIIGHAKMTGASSVRVTTECENTAAWSLYQSTGFYPALYTAVFHLVR